MALDAARLVLGISIFPLKKFIYYFGLGATSHNIPIDLSIHNFLSWRVLGLKNLDLGGHGNVTGVPLRAMDGVPNC